MLTLQNCTLGRPRAVSELSSWFAPPKPVGDLPVALHLSHANHSEQDLRELAVAYVRWSAGRYGTPSDQLIAAPSYEQLGMPVLNETRGMCGVFS